MRRMCGCNVNKGDRAYDRNYLFYSCTVRLRRRQHRRWRTYWMLKSCRCDTACARTLADFWPCWCDSGQPDQRFRDWQIRRQPGPSSIWTRAVRISMIMFSRTLLCKDERCILARAPHARPPRLWRGLVLRRPSAAIWFIRAQRVCHGAQQFDATYHANHDRTANDRQLRHMAHIH